MYEWLRTEMELVRTNKFHLRKGPNRDPDLICDSIDGLKMPSDYLQFLREIGEVRMYRDGDGYLVGIYGAAREVSFENGDTALCFGHKGSAKVYFQKSTLGEQTAPVFERCGQKFRKVAESFDSWVRLANKYGRAQFSKREWTAILEGPPPFSENELRIVDARRLYEWRVMCVNVSGDVVFEISNRSSIVLPYLSVGVRDKRGGLEGGVWLDVRHILPGSTGLVEKDCYKSLLKFENVEVYALPDPEPEDRERYWEFRQN